MYDHHPKKLQVNNLARKITTSSKVSRACCSCCSCCSCGTSKYIQSSTNAASTSIHLPIQSSRPGRERPPPSKHQWTFERFFSISHAPISSWHSIEFFVAPTFFALLLSPPLSWRFPFHWSSALVNNSTHTSRAIFASISTDFVPHNPEWPLRNGHAH